MTEYNSHRRWKNHC